MPGWQKKQKPFQPRDLSICFLTVRNCIKWETAGQETTAAYSLSSHHSPSDEEVCGQWRLSTCLRTWHSSSGHSEHTMYTHSQSPQASQTMYTQRVNHLKPHRQCTHTSNHPSLRQCTCTYIQSLQASQTMYTHIQSVTSSLRQCTHTASQSPQASQTMYTHKQSAKPQCTHTSSLPPLPKPPQPLFTSKGANSYWYSPHQVLQ